jgi:putative flippase GtrA
MNKKLVWEIIRYLIFGVLTTLVNFAVYFAALALFGDESYLVSNIIAWVFAVAFAYVTNKLWVFESKSWAWPHVRKELAGFVSARLFSLAVEEAGLWLMIGALAFGAWSVPIPGHPVGGDVVAKFIMQVVVVLLNYVFSKLIIFRRKNDRSAR